ncbi:MAG: hypothetical protein C4524_08050 [Candidatus Zixiibacteriota bacterium]|nr:MAG: hypothetical protein C4524_08050 [candidate division Zixibacteria bacterium]
MDETVYWAHLAAVEGVGGALIDELIKRFGSLKRAMEAPLDQVKEIPNLDARTAEAVCRAAHTLPATRAKMAALAKLGLRVVIRLDNAYPPRLRQAFNPPPVIYLAGEFQPGDRRTVAIIGSRQCSDISARRAREYAAELARAGLTVVSGYAPGVDEAAHRGTLEAGGRTIVVPGCGAERFDFTPLADQGVASFADLAGRGVWLSEQPPEAGWSGQGSLARNRLVAALAGVLLVIEAQTHSSTLNTVERGIALGRPVFVQDFATLTQRVMGNEALKREGAGIIRTAADLDQVVAAAGDSDNGRPERTEDPRR